jgi:hypothetical protein
MTEHGAGLRELHPQAVKVLKQQRQALELRKGGATYLEIGEALGVKKRGPTTSSCWPSMT